MFDVFRKGEGRLIAMPKEDGIEAQLAADGLSYEMLAFDRDQAGGCASGAGEGGAEFLDARVLAAFDKAETGTEWAGRHRGDFTLPV